MARTTRRSPKRKRWLLSSELSSPAPWPQPTRIDDSLTYALVGGSAVNGAASVQSDGSFTFTPTSGFVGEASFQFIANDGSVDSAPQTVTVTVAERPSLAVNTLADDSYDGGTLADELADGGGLSLREAIGLINDGTVTETLITFDQSIAGGQITAAGGLTLSADMDHRRRRGGHDHRFGRTNRVLTIDGGASDITRVAERADHHRRRRCSVNRGGGVRVFARRRGRHHEQLARRQCRQQLRRRHRRRRPARPPP